MNATVTKSAKSTKKIAVKKAVTSTRSQPTGKAATAKPAAKSTAKALAGKIVKAVNKAIKPAVKSVATAAKKAPAKSAVKSGKVTANAKVVAKKSAAAKIVQPAAKPAVKAKAAVKETVQPIKKVTASAPKAIAVTANKDASRSGADSSKKVISAPVDKIEQPVVSKVREVATKSSKATPTDANDGALLTEAQIMKMGEKDYMNAAQLAFFKNRLQQLEKDLLKNADETTEHLRETVLVPDPADRATIEEEHALELRTRDRERKLLKKVQQSIASIDAGDYGWCEETGEPIGVPRLLARPTATLSLEAQQRRELKQKLYGD